MFSQIEKIDNIYNKFDKSQWFVVIYFDIIPRFSRLWVYFWPVLSNGELEHNFSMIKYQ